MQGDLRLEQQPESVAVYLVDTGAGLAVIDPGPSSCRDALEAALAGMGATVRDLRHVLLTHIHLDHAGISGSLVRQEPRITVYVHQRGAAHMVDPTRLLASATRIYGDAMDTLWGEFLPVPRDNLRVLDGGEHLVAGSRRWLAGATPGHAVHHIAWLDEHEGIAFTGDVAGECTQHQTPALPAAPPPDIDLPSWRTSLDLLLSWRPEALLLTHFGQVSDPTTHINELWDRLVRWSHLVDESLTHGTGTDDERATAFADAEYATLIAGLPDERRPWVRYDTVHSAWFGLSRYLRKAATRPPTGSA
jgi:glyoxylase-like metal-dependent hydrolase (beta-lactamase superfamily II)